MTQIYLSYRHTDSSAKEANILYDQLVQIHGESSIIRTPEREDRIIPQIQYEVEKCEVVLVVIGLYWSQIVDELGRNLLQDPYDPTHVEIASAIEYNKPLMIVLVDGAERPHLRDLPKELERLSKVRTISLKSGENLETDATNFAIRLQDLDQVFSRFDRQQFEESAPVKMPEFNINKGQIFNVGIVLFVLVMIVIMFLKADNGSEVEPTEVVAVATVELAPTSDVTSTPIPPVAYDASADFLDTTSDLSILNTYELADPSVISIAYASSNTLGIGSMNGSLKILNLETEFTNNLTNQSSQIAAIDFDASREHIAFTSERNLIYYELETRRTSRYALSVENSFVDFNPNSAALLTGWTDTTVAIWDVSEGSLLTRSPIIIDARRGESVVSAVFSPDGDHMLVGEGNGAVQMWDLTNFSYSLIFPFTSPVDGLAYTLDGQYFATSSRESTKNSIRIWNVNTLKEVHNFKVSAIAKSLMFNQDGSVLYVGGADGILYSYNLKTETVAELPLSDDALYDLALNSDGTKLAVASNNVIVLGDSE